MCKFKLKCNSIIFLLKKFQNVIKAHVMCLRMHFIPPPPPPHPKILYETLSGNTGKYSILDLGIVPPFGRADTVNLKQNSSRYCPPPSYAIIYIYISFTSFALSSSCQNTYFFKVKGSCQQHQTIVPVVLNSPHLVSSFPLSEHFFPC